MERKVLVSFLILALVLGITTLSSCGLTRTAGYHYPAQANQQTKQTSPTPVASNTNNYDNIASPVKKEASGYSAPTSISSPDLDAQDRPEKNIKNFILAFIDSTLQLFMRYNVEYKDVALSAIKSDKGDVYVKCDKNGSIQVYNPVMSISTGRAVIRGVIQFETSTISAQIPQFWSQTLTEMMIQEITPDTNAFTDRQNSGLAQQLMQFFGQQTGKTREQVYQIMLSYFLKQDASGLCNYVDSCAGTKIFEDMTTNHDQNVQILYDRLN